VREARHEGHDATRQAIDEDLAYLAPPSRAGSAGAAILGVFVLLKRGVRAIARAAARLGK
jgi:hypothetical protein